MLIAEQILCWLVGIALLVLTFRLVHKDKWGFAGFTFVLGVIIFCCGLGWVQGLAKTWIVANVNARLAALGQQVDNVQTTTAKMQTELEAQQAKIDKHQKEIDDQQSKLRTAQTNILAQSGTLSNAVQQVALVESALAAAQTNLNAQQRTLTNVESLVTLLYSKSELESFSVTETNKVIILASAGVQTVVFRLNYAPVPNSVSAIVVGKGVQLPLLPELIQLGNVLITKFTPGTDLSNARFSFRYIKDSRVTALAHTLLKVTTNSVSIDGSPPVTFE